MTEIPSSSGARLSGDDYQHLFTWLHALGLLRESSGITRLEIEAEDAGNVDDLIVHRKDQPNLYHQVKFVMSQKQPLTHEWFTAAAPGAKSTPLARFHKSFIDLADGGVAPEMALHTNRHRAGEDPLLNCLDGRTNKLVPRLKRAGPGSDAGKVRAQWAQVLGISEEDLYAFLEHLEIRSGRDSLEELRERCAIMMEAVRLRGDEAAVDLGTARIRRLIEDGCRSLNTAAMQEMVTALDLFALAPRATLAVQALDWHVAAPDATAAVEWVDLFEGGEPRQRRQLKDPADWNAKLRPDLQRVAAEIRAHGHSRVLLIGAFRLSTGFTAGAELADVAGFQVALRTPHSGEWASDGDKLPVDIVCTATEIEQGQDLAIGVSVSGDLSNDVIDSIRAESLPVKTFFNLTPAAGVGREALGDARHARGWTMATFDQIRRLTRKHTETVHLFLFAPLGAAVLLGHAWNRMPTTQLYDDLGAQGYAPTYLIPG